MNRAVRLTLLAVLALAPALPVQAAVFTVTKTADTRDGACDRDCSLREALTEANLTKAKDIIELPAGNYVLSRSGAGEDSNATGDLDINNPLILVGAGAGSTVIDGNGTDRVLDIGAEAEIFGVTLRNGRVSGEGGGGLRARGSVFEYPVLVHRSRVSGNFVTGGDGGGLLGEGESRIVLAASTVWDNRTTGNGGGVAGGDLVLVNSTVSSNNAGGLGGGIYTPVESLPPITGSTIAFNRAGVAGGGLYAASLGTPTVVEPHLGSSILAGNVAPADADCFGAASLGYNLIGVDEGCALAPSDRRGTVASPLDPRLGPLEGHGPTPVHRPLAGSPVLGLVAAQACPASDQLGQARTAPCDAGAVEVPDHPACIPGESVLCLQDGRFRVTASWSSGNGAASGEAGAVPLTDDSGDFWFFSPENLELMVKILDGCPVNRHWWIFSSGLTDLGVRLQVEDLTTGEVWTNTHSPGATYAPRLDTTALSGCEPGGSTVSRAGGAAGVGSSILVPTLEWDTFDGVCNHDCSLRDAVVAANNHPGPDVIVLGPGIYTLARPGLAENDAVNGDLDVHDSLVILGAGADRTVLDGGNLDRVLEGKGPSSLEVHGVTVRNGHARQVLPRSDTGAGGGIAGDEVILVGCAVTGNQAQTYGGGILAWSLTVRDSTISDNVSGASGGGIFGPAFLRLDNVTVSGNRAAETGGGLSLDPYDHVLTGVTITGNTALVGGGLEVMFATCPSGEGFCRTDFGMTRSIVAGNSASQGPDCSGLEEGQASWNVFGIDDGGCNRGSSDRAGTPAQPLDPRLTPLGDHGGPTPTHALLADSLALDLAPPFSCSGQDQRGRHRPAGPGCDAGAVERLPACQPDATTLCLGAGDRFRVTARWTSGGETDLSGARPLGLDTGAFWFFVPDNLELTVKVLDGCGVNNRFWVFLSGLTDVAVEVTVEDTATGRTWTHTHPGGSPLQPRLDTNALDVCAEEP